MLFITPGLRVADQACDRVAVMQAGRVVETGPRQDDFSRPAHAYLQALLASVSGRSEPHAKQAYEANRYKADDHDRR